MRHEGEAATPEWRHGFGQRMLTGGVLAAATLVLGLVGVVQPLLAARSEALASIARSERALSRLAAWSPPGSRPSDEARKAAVAAVVTETAAARRLTIRRLEPSGFGAVLEMEPAAFADVLQWIAELEVERGLRVVALELDRAADPGHVRATLTVDR